MDLENAPALGVPSHSLRENKEPLIFRRQFFGKKSSQGEQYAFI
jgi:hypothetical protein